MYPGSTFSELTQIGFERQAGVVRADRTAVSLPADVEGMMQVATPELPKPVKLTWGNVAIEEERLELERKGTDLVLRVHNPSQATRAATRAASHARSSEHGFVTLADERVLTAEFLSLDGSGFAATQEGVSYQERIGMFVWSLPPAGCARAWVMELPKLSKVRFNLHLANRKGG